MLSSLKSRYKCWKIARIERKIDRILDNYLLIPGFENSEVRYYNGRIAKVWLNDAGDVSVQKYNIGATEKRIKLIRELRKLKGVLE